jgi:hypothetical protein
MTDTTRTTSQPYLPLNDGRSIPQLGLGVWQVPDADTPAVVRAAVDAGYRAIDTAALYHNERGVGEAVRAAAVPREELFVTTKLWHDHHAYDAALRAFDASLERLGLEHVDLYLIHWPAPKQGRYVDAWKALVRLREEGRARSVGVSNFNRDHLERVADATGGGAGGEPDRAAPAVPAARAARIPRRAGDRDRVVEPARPGEPARRPDDRLGRAQARQGAGAGHHPLAPRRGARRDPEVGARRAHPRELRRVRLLARRRRPARRSRPSTAPTADSASTRRRSTDGPPLAAHRAWDPAVDGARGVASPPRCARCGTLAVWRARLTAALATSPAPPPAFTPPGDRSCVRRFGRVLATGLLGVAAWARRRAS